MSEEKSTFKITDRRLFNPDGTPRDAEERPEEPSAAAPSFIDSTASDMSSTETAASRESSSTSAPRAATGPAPSTERPRDETMRPSSPDQAEDITEIDDSNDFVNLIMFIASPAAAALGMTEHPVMTGRDIDLPLAKHCIDLLGALQQKTRGNTTPQEQQILEGLLTELRMQYVSLTGSGISPIDPRGFTGRDITGGR